MKRTLLTIATTIALLGSSAGVASADGGAPGKLPPRSQPQHAHGAPGKLPARRSQPGRPHSTAPSPASPPKR